MQNLQFIGAEFWCPYLVPFKVYMVDENKNNKKVRQGDAYL